MKLTLNHTEMTTAIALYVKRVFTGLDPNAVVTVDMRAGRGENGYTAEVDITMPEDMVEQAVLTAPAVAKPSLAPRKPTTTSTPKEEQSEEQEEQVENVADDVKQPETTEIAKENLPFEPNEELGESSETEKATPSDATVTTGIKRPLFAKRN